MCNHLCRVSKDCAHLLPNLRSQLMRLSYFLCVRNERMYI